MVENSDKVRGLYSKTFQAERDAAEVERQLTMMEENQQELDSYLDRYEKEIDNLMKMHGVGGRSDGLRGPDQERERTYVACLSAILGLGLGATVTPMPNALHFCTLACTLAHVSNT